MPRNRWFETVAVAQERARKRLPKPVYGALLAASSIQAPRPMMDHSKPARATAPERVPVTIGRR